MGAEPMIVKASRIRANYFYGGRCSNIVKF
jgi:hypothetical protein